MAYGDGTRPRQRADGRWIATVEAGYTTRGTRRRRSVVAATEAECKRRLRSLKREMAADRAAPASTRTTVRSWADQWLEVQATRTRPASWSTTESVIRTWVVPTIGQVRLSDLTAADIRRVETAMRQAGRAQSSIARARASLTKMLRDARAEGYSVPAAVDAVPPVHRGPRTRTDIPARQCVALLGAATTTDRWPPLPDDADDRQRRDRRLAGAHDATRWAAALLQGMRQGECLGLTWDRVDMDAGTITVDRQLVVPTRRAQEASVGAGWYDTVPLSGRYVLAPVKTAAGRRVVPMIPWVLRLMERWREVCPPSPYGLVWPRPGGGPWSAGDDLAAWRGLQVAAGVSRPGGGLYVLHEARHSTATLLMALEVPVPVVLSIMGHASASSTVAYQHARVEDARRALERVGAVLRLEG